MSGESQDQVPAMVRSIYPPLVLIVISIVMIGWSYSYNPIAREVPVIVSFGLLVLSIIDLLSRLDLRFSRLLSDLWGADFRNREMKHNPVWTAEIGQVLWVVGCVVAMLTIGILPSVPLFVMLYMAVYGRRRWFESLAVAALVFAFVYVVFEFLLEYQLYRGVLFDGSGFASW